MASEQRESPALQSTTCRAHTSVELPQACGGRVEARVARAAQARSDAPLNAYFWVHTRRTQRHNSSAELLSRVMRSCVCVSATPQETRRSRGAHHSSLGADLRGVSRRLRKASAAHRSAERERGGTAQLLIGQGKFLGQRDCEAGGERAKGGWHTPTRTAEKLRSRRQRREGGSPLPGQTWGADRPGRTGESRTHGGFFQHVRAGTSSALARSAR